MSGLDGLDATTTAALEAARHQFLRLTPEIWTIANATVLAVAVVAAVVRIGLRLAYFRKLHLDDILMLTSLTAMFSALGVGFYARDLIFDQVQMALRLQPIDADSDALLSRFLKFLIALNVLQWITIFLVKMTYLTFFASIVQGLSKMVLWWKITIAVVAISAFVCMLLPITTCTTFEGNILYHCSYKQMFSNEATWGAATVAIDIVTDLMIISIPIMVIRRVQFDIKRKVGLGCILCLSVVMIVIAIIRISAAFLPHGIVDTVWLMFWQSIEASVAIIMVSATGFRSLFGQRRAASRAANSPTPPANLDDPGVRELGHAVDDGIESLLEKRAKEPGFHPRATSPLSQYVENCGEAYAMDKLNDSEYVKASPVQPIPFWERMEEIESLKSPNIKHMLSGETLHPTRSDSLPGQPPSPISPIQDIREPEPDPEEFIAPIDEKLLPDKPIFPEVPRKAHSRPPTPKVVRFEGGTKEFLKSTSSSPTLSPVSTISQGFPSPPPVRLRSPPPPPASLPPPTPPPPALVAATPPPVPTRSPSRGSQRGELVRRSLTN